MFFLIICAFLAGFVDSIVGGGGLIQLPALFVFLPPELSVQVAPVLGTNKFSSICGTTVATFQYARKVPFNWRILVPAIGSAFAFCFLGARAISLLSPGVIKPLSLLLLIAAAYCVFTRKSKLPAQSLKVPSRWQILTSLAIGCALGFYDGFFRPGTGTFL